MSYLSLQGTGRNPVVCSLAPLRTTADEQVHYENYINIKTIQGVNEYANRQKVGDQCRPWTIATPEESLRVTGLLGRSKTSDGKVIDGGELSGSGTVGILLLNEMQQWGLIFHVCICKSEESLRFSGPISVLQPRQPK
ncbi:hypothetical protein EVAR_96618_1 [Eumeta japonica]|uniref:Uncharacterized protein n=1 Tax=Eumeta variegata TaxID=151549 RepID=A0A4C1WSX3_EUMVA|nr:hypothetical protein EVAR_96618_1 [Eumeta japonica]